ncbi:DNA polymerase, beta domain protein region [Treponema primitia ZAS-2]|uniref:DNA polymerase, beta domain protein region n=1 Tax=Treponema primitia (strain ATCC BAA-887 / DSM 12427 / ZAS-2) TaxID=545694 RepID=F5YJ09_TREPZ|nr:nucleotidyltransferase domain-containing protein [Treponema primitia]AEF83824.1 DNA polymerase, beta domain protein region [Treponema primitia ZAS-2]
MKINFDKDIQLIKETILNNIDAKSIYLFGSYAYGKPNEDSDIDIYTVLPDKYKNTTEIYAKIIRELSDKNIFFIDLLLVNENIFNSRKNDYILENTIYNKGKIIYES